MKRTNIFIASSSEMHHERLELVDLFTDMCSETMEYIPVKWEYMPSDVHKEHKQSEYMRRLQKCEICMVMFWRSLGKYTEKELYLALDEQSKGDHLQKTFILFKEDGESVSSELSEFKKKCVQQHGDIVHSFSNNQELRELAKNLVLSANVKCNESNWDGKDVKVMIAADEELNEEKLEFTELMAHLNEVLENRGIRLRRVKWTPQGEDDFRKELHDCEMCLNLYWTQLPRQADEEMKVAYNLSTNGANPLHLYIFFKEPSEEISTALADFKAGFETVYGHFFCRFENVDTMNLHFILQFEAKQNILERNSVKVENGDIVIDANHFIDMDKLPFVALNKDYKIIKEELESLPEEIEMFRLMVKAHPDQQKYSDQLQKKLNHYNALKEELSLLQQTLFSTAKRIAEIQLEEVSSELQRAINEFEAGHVEAANAILDGIEKEGDLREKQLDIDRATIHKDIEVLLLKTNTLMANIKKPIEQRIKLVIEKYQKAERKAQKSALEKGKYSELLLEFGEFLQYVGKYNQALTIYQRVYRMNKELYGENHPNTATSINYIGLICLKQAKYKSAIKYILKALRIRERILDQNHPDMIQSYNNIGYIHYCLGDYDEALEYYQKVKEYPNHPFTATLLNNIGLVYFVRFDFDKALDYYEKALVIQKEVLEKNHPDTAKTNNNIGSVFQAKGEFDKALGNYKDALDIQEKNLGWNHPDTALYNNNIGLILQLQGNPKAKEYLDKALEIWGTAAKRGTPESAIIYNNIAFYYYSQCNFAKARTYCQKALRFSENAMDSDHPVIATSYYQIGLISLNQYNYDEAMEAFQKARKIQQLIFGPKHPELAMSNYFIGLVYYYQGDYVKSMKNFQKARKTLESVFGKKHPNIATSYFFIGLVYIRIGDYDRALTFNQKAKRIFEKSLGLNNPNTAVFNNSIGEVYMLKGKYDLSLKYYQEAQIVFETVLGQDNLNTAISYNGHGEAYRKKGQYDVSLEYHEKARVIREKLQGLKHPDTALSYNNIGMVYSDKGDNKQALKYFKMALIIQEKKLGVTHPLTALSYNNIGMVYYYKRKYARSLELLQKALDIWNEKLGEGHPNTIMAKKNIELVKKEQFQKQKK